jgi:hypothetical protein
VGARSTRRQALPEKMSPLQFSDLRGAWAEGAGLGTERWVFARWSTTPTGCSVLPSRSGPVLHNAGTAQREVE